MDLREETQLSIERALGEKARNAWHEFFKPFFDQKEVVLIEAFRACGLRDEEGLVKIKMQFQAIDALRSELLGYMDTGKLADISLNELEVEREKEKGNG